LLHDPKTSLSWTGETIFHPGEAAIGNGIHTLTPHRISASPITGLDDFVLQVLEVPPVLFYNTYRRS
jgi:hypothetical protein